MAPPLYVVFLWHMHQPLYQHPVSGQYVLPWVRLHGIKDYYDVVRRLEDFPRIHQTVNLVPSLLDQLLDCVEGKPETFLEIARKVPSQLSSPEKEFLLRNFFALNWETMLFPHPRYRELLQKRGEAVSHREDLPLDRFTDRDWLDLQVWFHLAWSGRTLKEDPSVRALMEKGEGFSQQEKEELLARQNQLLSQIIPLYRRLCDAGQVELSCSPYYHPILPLIQDTANARKAVPEVKLPEHPFAYPQDVRAQIQKAAARFEELFGHRPRGMWPSEGSVSEDILDHVMEAGLRWIASDEEVLRRSLVLSVRKPPHQALSPQEKYVPYVVSTSRGEVRVLFRDHELSDLLGFVYTRWKEGDAAHDLFQRLLRVKEGLAGAGPHVVAIMLDGENAWEYYPSLAEEFFPTFYGLLSSTSELQCVTVSEALEAVPARPLQRLQAGSWVNAGFQIWIGQTEKNRAWDCLARARKLLDEHPVPDADALRHIYIAEGSDWFWWYGDDHSSDFDPVFDHLFRSRLAEVYLRLKEPVPRELSQPLFAEVQPRPVRTREERGTMHQVWKGEGPRLKVCMLAAEVGPYARVGGLGDVMAALPCALIEQGVEAKTFAPLYGQVREFPGVKKITELGEIRMGGHAYRAGLYADTTRLPPRNYFIENPKFFDREGIYTDPESGEGYPDNFERFNFFALAVLETLRELQWKPDVIHCHDSHPALVPAYLRLGKGSDAFFKDVSTVLTIHNLAYQGVFGPEKFKLTGLPEELLRPMGPFEYYGKLNMMKAGICYADILSTVSRQYAREIQANSEHGCGLESVLRMRRQDLYGILNGIDTREWDPATDPLIFAHFSAREPDGKKINKEKLKAGCGLPASPVPLVGIISRLVEQKGFDLLLQVKDDLLKIDCQWVILGTGVPRYHQELNRLAREYPQKFSVHLKFDNQLAHRIEAGSDMFLMPSRYEPCGLNQMYSMRYGSIPIVRHTGGLADTVQEFDPRSGRGNGFKFFSYDGQELLKAIHGAIQVWQNPELWRRLVKNAMTEDFSWERGAREYVSLYERALNRP